MGVFIANTKLPFANKRLNLLVNVVHSSINKLFDSSIDSCHFGSLTSSSFCQTMTSKNGVTKSINDPLLKLEQCILQTERKLNSLTKDVSQMKTLLTALRARKNLSFDVEKHVIGAASSSGLSVAGVSSSRSVSDKCGNGKKRPFEAISDSDDSLDTAMGNIPLDEANNTETPLASFIRDDADFVVVYTDGACENNGKSNAKAGIGVWFNHNHPLNVSKPVSGRATNNTAEIQACIVALETCHSHGVKKLRIRTDSQFVINAMSQWIHGWKRKGWKLSGGGDVKNKIDFVQLDKSCQLMEKLVWEHVNGHQGIVGNEEADRLARAGALNYKKD